jgi:hypothetical protein
MAFYGVLEQFDNLFIYGIHHMHLYGDTRQKQQQRCVSIQAKKHIQAHHTSTRREISTSKITEC